MFMSGIILEPNLAKKQVAYGEWWKFFIGLHGTLKQMENMKIHSSLKMPKTSFAF